MAGEEAPAKVHMQGRHITTAVAFLKEMPHFYQVAPFNSRSTQLFSPLTSLGLQVLEAPTFISFGFPMHTISLKVILLLKDFQVTQYQCAIYFWPG